MKLSRIIIASTIISNIFVGVTFANDPAENVPDIYIDNVKMEFADAKPLIDENDRLLIPVRMIGEAIGAKVIWEPDYGNGRVEIISKNDANYTVFDIGSNVSFLNGTRIYMDTEAKIINDYTYIPLRYIGEAMNYTVNPSDDMTRVDLIKKADNPVFVYEENTPPEYTLRFLFGSLDEYGCDVELLSENDIPQEWENTFAGKELKGPESPLNYDAFFADGPPVYYLNNTIYSENVNSTNSKMGLNYSAYELRNLSEDILIEYIPNNLNDTGNISISLHKNYYTKTAELSQQTIAMVQFPANKHSVAKVKNIYTDNYIAPFFGVDKNIGYWLEYTAAKDDDNYSGTVRITCFGEPINK